MPSILEELLGNGIAGSDFGNRLDGTKKGLGFFGPILRPDGGVSTELSFDFDHGGKNIFAPLMVPTLTRGELDHLLSDGEPTPEIYDKAQVHAIGRMQKGLPTFSLPNEIFPYPVK